MSDPNNVYIGRRGVVFVSDGVNKRQFPHSDSPWANPYKVGKDGTRDEVLAKYESLLQSQLTSDPNLVAEGYCSQSERVAEGYCSLSERVAEGYCSQSEQVTQLLSLKGKNVGCWCKPLFPCHGDILVKYINLYSSSHTPTVPTLPILPIVPTLPIISQTD